MPTIKVTPDIEDRILQLHRTNQRFKNIGRQLGLDWRTVKGGVSQADQIRERKHWEAVTLQVDAHYVRQHYMVLMLLAQEVRKELSCDPTEPGHAEAKVCLANAQDRAVHRALDHDVLAGMPQVPGVGGAIEDISQARLGYLLFRPLEDHEPKSKKLITQWKRGWDAVIRERDRLTSQVKMSLLKIESKEKFRIGLTRVQAAKNFEAALTEALEYKLKELELMNLRLPQMRLMRLLGGYARTPTSCVRYTLERISRPSRWNVHVLPVRRIPGAIRVTGQFTPDRPSR